MLPRSTVRYAVRTTVVVVVAACADGEIAGPARPELSTSPPPISHTLLTNGFHTVNGKVYTTASIAPAPDALITVAVLAHRSYGANAPPILTGGGMSAWTVVHTVTFDPASAGRKRLTVYRAMSSAPGSGPITVTFESSVSNVQWIVSQWANVETGGVNGAGAIRQVASLAADSVNVLTVQLGPFASEANFAYGAFGAASSAPAMTPGPGFALIAEQPSNEGTTGDLMAEWAVNQPAISATWNNLAAAAIGIELMALSGAPPPGNSPPVASFVRSCTGLTCTFTNTSTDTDGSVMISQWDLGDGFTTSSTSPSHTYAAAGTYTVQLTVTDNLGATGSTSRTVTVSPPPDGSAVLVGAGDIAVCSSTYDEATALLLDSIPGTVFTAGDNVYPDGTAAEFANCYEPNWGRHKTRTRPSPGNHDYHTPGAAGYFDYFGANAGDPAKGYYSYDIGGWHIVALNSSISMGAGSEQEQWLRADLAASNAQCTLAYWHYPRFSSGPHGNRSSTRFLWRALYDYGAEVVISAHDHLYERFAPQTPDGVLDVNSGIRQFVVGTGGASLYQVTTLQPNSEVTNDQTHGVLKLTLYPDSYTWEFVPVAGGTFQDAGSGDCHGTSAPPPNAPPTASFTASCTGLTCAFTNTSTDADGSIVTSAWDLGDGATSSATSPSHTYAAAGTYIVALTVTDDSGAANSTSQPVTVTVPNQPPTASFTVACTGLACEFTNTSSDSGGTIATSAWDLGDGTTSNARTPTHTYAADGTYVVALTVTDDSGAVDSTSQPVTVANLPPQPAFTVNCNGLTCQFTDGSADPDGTVTGWSWSFGDGATASDTNPTHTYAASGTYSVTLTVSDNVGASDSASQPVTVTKPNEPPVAGFEASCTGLVCQFTDTSTDPDGTVAQWNWAFGDGGTASDTNPEHSYPAGGTYTVTLTVTDDSGAVDSTSQPVTVTAPNQSPTASFTVSCTGRSCDFTNTSVDPGGSIVASVWDLGDGATSSVTSPSHTYAADGTYVVALTVTDDSGAVDSTSQPVTVANAPPIAAFATDCSGLTCQFTDASGDADGGVTGWSWAFGDGATASDTNPAHTYAASGTFTVELTVTDNDGASDATSQAVMVTAPNAPPQAGFSANCTGLACQFTDTSTDADGAVTQWSWTFGDGGTATDSIPAHTYAAGGTYTVALTVRDDSGAVDSTAQLVTVANLDPTAAFTVSCTSLRCEFTDGSSDVDGSVTAWSWAFGDGATGSGPNPAHTYTASGSYTVGLTVTDNAGGSGTTSQTVLVAKVNDPPVAGFAVSCAGLDCQFTDGSTDADGAVTQWSWAFGDGETASDTNPAHTYASPGTYTVTLVVTDDSSAVDSTSQPVTVTAPIALSAVGGRVKGVHTIELTWSGATSTNVDVFRNGVRVATVPNSGRYTDSTGNKGGGQSYVYRVCEAGSSVCSDSVTVSY